MQKREERSTLLARLRQFCGTPGGGVLFDEPGGLFYDAASAKALGARLAALSAAELRQDKQSGRPYLALAYEDGVSLALTEAGVAFAPAFSNTGPLPELPSAVCLRDYFSIRDRLKHELYGHLDTAPSKDTVRLVLLCIAILEGARLVGFDVGREERELEQHLAELERRGAPAS